MLAEVSLLTTGLPGAVVISIFSTVLDGGSGFLVSRTLPATAVLFSEPELNVQGTYVSRQSTTAQSQSSCSRRPIIPIGQKLTNFATSAQRLPPMLLKNVIPPLLRPMIDTAINRWSNLSIMLSSYKSKVWEKLGLRCLFPRLRQPFEPILEHFRCELGISKDPYVEASSCNRTICRGDQVEVREITMSKPVPRMIDMNLAVQTIDDCFPGMRKLVYGARVLMKIIDDQYCGDSNYERMCTKLFEDKQVVVEEGCSTPRYGYRKRDANSI